MALEETNVVTDLRVRADHQDGLSGGAFELDLHRPGASQRATLRILGNTFELHLDVDGARETTRQRFDSALVAVAVFEHHMAKLLAAGFCHVSPPPSPFEDVESLIDEEPEEPAGYLLLAELLKASGDPRAELIEISAARLKADTPELRNREEGLLRAHDLFGALDDVRDALPATFWYEQALGFVREAAIADADAVALADEFEPPLLRTDRHKLGFDPRIERPASHTYAVHALRRLLHHPAGRFIRRLRLEINAEIEPILPLLVEHGRVDRVTHLTVASRAARALGPSFPALLSLACYARSLDPCTAVPLSHLVRLTVRWEATSLSSVLAALQPTRLPALQHLSLWDAPLDARSTAMLLDEPLMKQLKGLDLWSQVAPQRGMYEALLEKRGELAHLQRLVLAPHGAPADLVAQFADWPAVVWADRRREGLDEADREAIAGFPLGGFLF